MSGAHPITTNYGDFFRKLLFVIIVLLFGDILKAREITLASYNVENLFDMHRDGTEYAEYVPGRHGWNEAMLAKKISNLTEVICDLEADVVALQEVENDRVLSHLQRSLERAGCRYRYRAITHTKSTPVHNALLSKIAFKKVQDVPVTRYGRHRSILEVVLDTDPPLRIFNNHWKSKRGPESERIVYAKALKKRLDKLSAGSEYILLGDFNSNYNESLMIDKKHNDTGGVTGINTVLHTMDGDRMVRLNTLSGARHYNLWMELGAAQRWSHNFFGDKEAIDAILIPPTLHDGKGWEYIEGSFGVYKPHYMFGHHGQVKRWAYRHGKHLGKGYSDHLPITAQFSNDGSTNKSVPSIDERPWRERLLEWIKSLFGGKSKPQNRPQMIFSSAPDKTAASNESENSSIDIAALKKLPPKSLPATLKQACVIFKSGDSAVIQQSPQGEAILLYRSAMQLEEGNRYNLGVYKKKRYKGLDELTDIEVSKSLGRCDPQKFIADFEPGLMNDMRNTGKIVANTKGRLEGRKIYIDGKAYPIHFRRRAGRPKNGSITIKKAMIGYYKDHMELVVWSKRDWK